jgi:hypothetical protein
MSNPTIQKESESKFKRILPNTVRSVAVAIALITGLGLAAASISATLTAEAFNTSAQEINSGTLSLTLANNGNGFSTSITRMLPGDTVNRYVKVTNGGTEDGKTLKLGLADSGSSALTTDGTAGLQLTVSECSVAWTVGTGVCSGTTTSLLSSTSLTSIDATAATLASTMAPAEERHLKLSLVLPDKTETTTNGSAPLGTIQGLTANITWTFSVVQRAATTTNS